MKWDWLYVNSKVLGTPCIYFLLYEDAVTPPSRKNVLLLMMCRNICHSVVENVFPEGTNYDSNSPS